VVDHGKSTATCLILACKQHPNNGSFLLRRPVRNQESILGLLGALKDTVCWFRRILVCMHSPIKLMMCRSTEFFHHGKEIENSNNINPLYTLRA
jgi:hypothetical protein